MSFYCCSVAEKICYSFILVHTLHNIDISKNQNKDWIIRTSVKINSFRNTRNKAQKMFYHFAMDISPDYFDLSTMCTRSQVICFITFLTF